LNPVSGNCRGLARRCFEAKANLLRLKQEIPLTGEEIDAID
jgi:hypothetical protein